MEVSSVGLEPLDRAAVASAWHDLELLLLEHGLERCSLCGGARLVGELCIRPACRNRLHTGRLLRVSGRANAPVVETWDCDEGCVECHHRARTASRFPGRRLAHAGEMSAHISYAASPEDDAEDRAVALGMPARPDRADPGRWERE